MTARDFARAHGMFEYPTFTDLRQTAALKRWLRASELNKKRWERAVHEWVEQARAGDASMPHAVDAILDEVGPRAR